MKLFALATAAALALSAPAFTTAAVAQDASVKVKIGEHGMTKKKVVIRHGDRGRHEGWRHRDVKKVAIHRDRGRHEGWRHRDSGMKRTVIIKKQGPHRTVIKKKTLD